MSSKRVALVTGGARGIGRAISEELARRGYTVAINYQRRNADACELRTQLREMGHTAEVFEADVSDYKQAQDLCLKVTKELGPIDLLVNNAGVTRDGLLLMMKEDNWKRVMDVNLNGVFNCSKAVVRSMCSRKSGVIINIGSGSGISPRSGQTNYSTTKAGLIGFTRSLARETAPYGVRALVVAPGFTRTEMAEMVSPRAMEESQRMIPMGRWGKPEEIAAVVGFMSSEEASYITGTTIIVDGGRAAGEQDFGPWAATSHFDS